MDLYPWVVVSHVFFVIVAFGAHGVSAFTMLQLKREGDRTRAAAVLDLSQVALVWAGIGLLVAVVLGIVAAVMGGHFGRFWPWASLIVVAVIWIAMTPMAAMPMAVLRKSLGMPGRADKKGDPPLTPGTDEEFAAAKARLRPELVGALGLVAILILVWLMEVKPF